MPRAADKPCSPAPTLLARLLLAPLLLAAALCWLGSALPAQEALTAAETPAARADAGPVNPEEGAEPAELLLAARGAYNAGDYARAIHLYQALLDSGLSGGHLLYNLGNAYLRNGELGRAVAAYRRSRGLLPRDEDVAANLAFARSSVRDALPPPEPSPALANLFFWHYRLSRPELARLALLLNGLFWLLAAARLFARRSELLRWALFAVLVPLLAVGASLTLRLVSPQPVAVVIPRQVDAYAETDPESVVRFHLHAGSEVRVTGRLPEWVGVALPDGERGWLPQEHVQVVEE